MCISKVFKALIYMFVKNVTANDNGHREKNQGKEVRGVGERI